MVSFKLMEEKMTNWPCALEQVLIGELFMGKNTILACMKGINKIAKRF